MRQLRSRQLGGGFRLLCLSVTLSVSGAAAAQSNEASAAAESSLVLSRPSLRDRVGVAPLERALRQSDPRARERALLRLSRLGTPRALEVLVRALEPSGMAQSPRERLLVVRGLWPYVKREANVRECLVRVMTGISSSAERGEPLHALLRDSAALALAASGDEAAIEALGKALRQPGRVAQAATLALLAHPPSELGPLLRGHRIPSRELLFLLDELADERAFEVLRGVVRSGSPELAAQAALALTRLGNFETVALARRWALAKEQPVLQLAAAQILALAHDADAAPLLAALLRNPGTRQPALAIAERGEFQSVPEPLLMKLAGDEPSLLPGWISLLGRSEAPAATALLGALVTNPAAALGAAYALALSPAPRAAQELARALQNPKTRRLAARAAVLSAVATGRQVKGNLEALSALARSREPADRYVGHFGLLVLRRESMSEALAESDELVVQAAAQASLWVGGAELVAARLARAPAGRTRTQLAVSLIDERARARVPNAVLFSLLSEGGPAALLALYALGERDTPETRPRLLEQLASPDPWRRSHVALGLALSPEASAVALLEQSYRFEIEPLVRRAIVQALSRRPERAARRTLELAASLDPDSGARETARLGLRGLAASPRSSNAGTLCLELAGGDAQSQTLALVLAPGGLALPLLADPDGVVAVVGLPAGAVEVRVALVRREDNAATRDHRP